MPILDWIFYGNSVRTWLVAFAIAISVLIVLYLSKRVIVRRLGLTAKQTPSDVDDLFLELLGDVKPFFLLFVSIYAAIQPLALPQPIVTLITSLTIIVALIQSAIWGTSIIGYWVNRYTRERLAQDAASVTTIAALGFISRVVLWAIILLLAIDNLGFDITAMVAGLGIGGIAVALAAQNILGDLFASLSIVLDKPFVLGDFIIVGDFMGSVEHIGLKTTRLRSLSGEQLIFSNSDLLQSRIRNYKRMMERRIVFTISVVYQTHYEKLKAIPDMLREIVTSQQPVRFDRAHFKGFGDFAINFEVVYFVLDPDYNLFMNLQQAINLEIYRRFQQEGIEFAYPTQTLFLSNGLLKANLLKDQTLEGAMPTAVEPAANALVERS